MDTMSSTGTKRFFPMPLGLSCTRNLDAIEGAAPTSPAAEGSADGFALDVFADGGYRPRSPLGKDGGRCGEDPYLGALIARAMVRGLSRCGPQPEQRADGVSNILPCAGGGSGRDYNTVDEPAQMHEYFLPPCRAAVEARVGSVMSSFNEIDGVPATTNRLAAHRAVADAVGFQGMVVTDLRPSTR